MARRWWTVTIVTDESGRPVRHIRLPREVVRFTIGAALFVVAGVSSLATVYFVDWAPAGTKVRLQARNALLESELKHLNTQIDTLALSLNRLEQKNEFYRLLAGLDPLAADDLIGSVRPTTSVQDRARFRIEGGRTAGAASTGKLTSLLRRARLLAFSWREAEDTLSERFARFNATPSIAPTSGYISSTFSQSRWHPILERPKPHTGIDIVAPYGAAVVASARGRVATVGYQTEYGMVVDVDHGYGVVTRYAHLSSTQVRVGETVERGQQLGKVGQSGLAVGPHLHYEVLIGGRPANPRRYIVERDVIHD